MTTNHVTGSWHTSWQKCLSCEMMNFVFLEMLWFLDRQLFVALLLARCHPMALSVISDVAPFQSCFILCLSNVDKKNCLLLVNHHTCPGYHYRQSGIVDWLARFRILICRFGIYLLFTIHRMTTRDWLFLPSNDYLVTIQMQKKSICIILYRSFKQNKHDNSFVIENLCNDPKKRKGFEDKW